MLGAKYCKFDAALALLTCMFPTKSFSRESIPLSDAIAVVESHELDVESLAFSVEIWRVNVRPERLRWQVVGSSRPEIPTDSSGVLRATARVEISPESGTFRAMRRTVIKSSTDLSEPKFRYLVLFEDYSNDGIQFRSQTRGFELKQEPVSSKLKDLWASEWDGTPLKSTGLIASASDEAKYVESDRDFLAIHGSHLGIGWVRPYVCTMNNRPSLLSEYLRHVSSEADLLDVTATEQDLWEILVAHPSYALKIFYNPVLGRIVRQEWGGCESCSGLSDWDRQSDWYWNYEARFQYNDESSAIPESVLYIEKPGSSKHFEALNGRPVPATQWTYSPVVRQQNEEHPFSLEFADNTEVTDYIEQRIFLVGKGIDQDQKEVEAFMLRQGLIQPGEVGSNHGAGLIRSLLLAGAVLVIIAGAFVYRRLRKGAFVFIAFLALPHIPSKALLHAEDRSPQVRQCGHLVAMATLNYFEKKVSPLAFQKEMIAGSSGISMAALKRFLEGCGLTVNARKNVSLKELMRLPLGSVCIVRFSLDSGRSHYVLVVPRPRAEPALVDVLASVRNLSDALRDATPEELGEIVLFVQRSEEKNRIKEETVNLRNVVVDDPEKLETTVTWDLFNSGKSPMLLESVVTGCSCVVPHWEPKIIEANETASVRLQVLLHSWGKGNKQVALSARFASGFTVQSSIQGQGISSEFHDQHFDVEPQQIVIHSDEPATGRERFLIRGSDEVISALRVSSDMNWLKPRIVPEEGEAWVFLEVLPSADLKEKLKSSTRTANAQINVEGPSGSRPVARKVLVQRAHVVRSKLSANVLRPGAPVYLRLWSDQPFSVVESTEEDIDGLVREITSVGSMAKTVKFSLADDYKRGSALLRCTVRGDWGEDRFVHACQLE